MELANTMIKRLLELISSYSFNLYYMKGKEMVLSDFLLQQSNDDSNPNEIIPISFNIYKILEDNRENFGKYNNHFSSEKYLIQTHSQAKMSGTKLLEVHGVQKELRSCKTIGYEFYCEELFIVKHKSSYSAIYFNLTMDIIKNNCNFDFYFNNTDITPTVLDRGDEIVLANWPNDKHITCNINNDIPVKIPSHL